MQLSHALTIAEWVRDELAPDCGRIEIGGSVRRGVPYPKDIELICEPRPAGPPVFGQALPREPLEARLRALVAKEKLIPWNKDGQRYKCFMARHLLGSIQLDLFICRPPTSWGWLLVLRTGPAEFTHWLVTKQSQGGACPDDMKFEDGQLWRYLGLPAGVDTDWVVVPTPTEESVFAALGLAYRPPHQRLARWKGKAHA